MKDLKAKVVCGVLFLVTASACAQAQPAQPASRGLFNVNTNALDRLRTNLRTLGTNTYTGLTNAWAWASNKVATNTVLAPNSDRGVTNRVYAETNSPGASMQTSNFIGSSVTNFESGSTDLSPTGRTNDPNRSYEEQLRQNGPDLPPGQDKR